MSNREDTKYDDTMGVAAKAMALARMPGIFHSFSRLGYRKRSKQFNGSGLRLTGKTVAITGANSGIGLAAAEAMVAIGANVVLLCRSRERGEAALRHVRSLAKHGGSAQLKIVDMTSLASIRTLATTLSSDPIHALVHNAGSLNAKRVVTCDELEFDFALHVAGPHLLTHLLMDRLRAATGRVIFVSSGGMYSERFSLAANDWAHRPYDGVRAYAQAKRAQVVLASLWAEHEPAVGVYAMHPGWVDTPGVEVALPKFYRRMRRWLRTPAEGADTIVWLAACASLTEASGSLWLDRRVVSKHLLPGTAEPDEERTKLWSLLQSLASETHSA